MKAKPSSLILEDFYLLQHHFEFVEPEEDEVDPYGLFEKYHIDIDFAHHDQDGVIQVIAKVNINQDNAFPGYNIFIEGVGFFSIRDSNKLKANEITNLKTYSTLNYVINNFRNIIAENTANAPMGPYHLPLLNILELFKKKKATK